MEDSNVPIFAQAKLEYTKQLVDVLYMNMYDGIRSIYDDSKRLYSQKPQTLVFIFRSLLENVPKWNTEIIESETDRIIKVSKCDWLDDLLTAVFISHTRILMSIGPNQNYNKINVTIPKTTTFIHKTYINIAREVWKNPYLFNEQVPGYEYQRNMKQLEDMIKLTIEDTIRRQLPIKEILREHLETYDEPRQSHPQQKPIDMQMIMDEIKKAQKTIVKEPSEPDEPSEPEEQEDTSGDEEEKVESTGIKFNKEEELEEPVVISETPVNVTSVTSSTGITSSTDVTSSNETMEPVNSYVPSEPQFDLNDDPDEEQIKKATQNIVLNDITEPVIDPASDNPLSSDPLTTTVEPVYDNTDIINDVSSPKKNLDEMVKDLNGANKGSEVTVEKPPLPKDVKPVSTDMKPTKPSNIASVIKIDDPMMPNATVSLPEPPKVESEPVKPEQPKKESSSPLFSFNNLYPSLSGKGKVEEITEDTTKSKDGPTVVKIDEPKPDEPKIDEPKPADEPKIDEPRADLNAEVMKEVVSLDKKQEQVDETETLDNFFNDVKQMTNSLEPIKEETKYVLFEDANNCE